MTDFDARTSRASDVNRNVMLYWDDADPFPQDIVAVSEIWRSFCPEWNVALFGKDMACRFLRENFGDDIAHLFLTCALPSMRADFFRVFWAISEGGIYSDVTFVPTRPPLFFDPEKNLTFARRSSGGIIVTGFFYSKKDCRELKLIACEIIKAVRKREILCILHATGPGAWMRALSICDTKNMSILSWDDLLENFIKFSRYRNFTHSTSRHWKQLQLRKSIYQDPP